jgi:hypothetical protein
MPPCNRSKVGRGSVESLDVGNKSIPQLSKGWLSFTPPPPPCLDKVRHIHKDNQRKEKKRKVIEDPSMSIMNYYYYYYYSKAAMSCLDKVPQIHKDNQGEKKKCRGPIHEYYYYSKQL